MSSSKNKPVSRASGGVTLYNVSFAYSGPPCPAGHFLQAPPGTRVGIAEGQAQADNAPEH